MTKSRKIINEIKYWDTKLKEKKKNNNQENEFHIWYINKTNQMKMNETKKI